jgi:hypothetical protein
VCPTRRPADRRCLRRAALLALVALPMAAPLPGSVDARQSTPGPIACTVTPRTVAEVVAVVNAPRAAGTPIPDAHGHDEPGLASSPAAGGPAAASPAPVREPTGPGRPLAVTLPDGEPASPEAVAAMTAAREEFDACANAGDSLRQMALVTDDYLRHGFAGAHLTEADVAGFVGTPRPIAPADQRTIAGVRGARVLPGGYLAALFDLAAVAGPVPGEIRTDFVVFAEHDGRLLVAAYVNGLPPEQFGPEATPAP